MGCCYAIHSTQVSLLLRLLFYCFNCASIHSLFQLFIPSIAISYHSRHYWWHQDLVCLFVGFGWAHQFVPLISKRWISLWMWPIYLLGTGSNRIKSMIGRLLQLKRTFDHPSMPMTPHMHKTWQLCNEVVDTGEIRPRWNYRSKCIDAIETRLTNLGRWYR